MNENKYLDLKVFDRNGKLVGRVSDVLGPWLAKPCYVSVRVSRRVPSIFGVKEVVIPIGATQDYDSFLITRQSKEELLAGSEYTELNVMEREQFQLSSVFSQTGT